jgi:hypothetical protein
VNAGQVGEITVGNLAVVRSPDYAIYSQEVTISGVTGTTVVVNAALKSGSTFTPAAGYFLEGVGFNDCGGYYRFD